ncbi:MAG: endonuclease/exonuclease/phosphatase family protein [Bacteroidia bacterium]|nr:endonuclease/exonuclease/phosphatase family protein [Bacteroidia bacterium]
MLNIGTTILLLLSYLAPIVPPDSFWPLSFFGLAYPYLVIINFIFLMIWVLQRSLRLLLPLIALLLGFNNFMNTFQVIPRFETRDSGVKVLIYNVHSFRYDLKTHRTNTPKILEYFKSTGAEIICLQEATLLRGGKLSPQGMKDALPEINYYQVASSGDYSGSITLSKFPIISMGEIRFPGSSNLVLFSDIKISNSQIIRIYNCHLQSYSIDPEDYTIIDSIGTGSNTVQINEARKMSYKLKVGFKLRAFQSRKVSDHIKKSPYPVIVCGDFNDTPVSYAYRKVRGDLKDAFVESGWGISNSYNGELPSFRIDYILYDQKFTSENYKRDRVYFSDHFPVHCQLNIE